MAVWADDDEIVCVHPGGAARGRAGGHPRQLRGHLRQRRDPGAAGAGAPAEALGCAVHHLVECIEWRRRRARSTAWVLATNVYLKTAQGWRLVAHHASPGPPHEPPEIGGDAPSTLH